jgi:hypothetical protein
MFLTDKSRKITKEDSATKASKPSKQESGHDISFAKKSLKMQSSGSSLQKEAERSKVCIYDILKLTIRKSLLLLGVYTFAT